MAYRRTQRVKIHLIAFAGVSGVIGALSVFVGGPLWAGPALFLVLIIATKMSQLTIEVSDQQFHCFLGPDPGVIRIRVPLVEIRSARAVVLSAVPYTVLYSPLAGWHIKLPFHRDAVEICTVGDKRHVVGTDEPQAVVDAIQSHEAMAT